jgi:hypothetical protein
MGDSFCVIAETWAHALVADEDREAARQAEIRGTPSFLVNGYSSRERNRSRCSER